MRRAALAVAFFLAAFPASASSAPLRARVRALLREIRDQAASPQKDVAALRAQLDALETENSAAPDDQVFAGLREAEEDLTCVDEGTPLPPPSAEEDGAGSEDKDEDAPDRDAVAQPAAPSGLIYQNVAHASVPEAAPAVFDGSRARGGEAPGPVAAPPEAPSEDLDGYLALTDDDARMEFMVSASSDLLAEMRAPDADGKRSRYLAKKLTSAIAHHPQRDQFVSLKVRVTKDRLLHLVYRVSDGGAVDEVLGPFAEWSKPRRRKPGHDDGKKPGHGGKKTRHGGGHGHGKKGHGGGAGGGDEGKDGDSSQGGHKSHSAHKHGGGGGGDNGGGGGDDGGGGGGGGGGKGGGASHHAKAPHIKGGSGGKMFDGGEDSGGDGALPGGGASRGHGGRARAAGQIGGAAASGGRGAGRRGASARAGSEESSSGGEEGAGDSSGSRRGPRRRRGSSGSEEASGRDDARAGSEGKKRRGGKGEDDEEGSSGGSFGEGEYRMGPLETKGFTKVKVPPPSEASAAAFPASRVASSAGTTVPEPAAAAGTPLSMPAADDGSLRDAVAAHEADQSPPAVAGPASPPVAQAATAAPAAPPADPRPLEVACAAAAAVGLAALAFRSRRS